MTKLQILKKELRDAKHQMFLCKPSIGYLGSQYPYWESEKERIENSIEELRSNKRLKVYNLR